MRTGHFSRYLILLLLLGISAGCDNGTQPNAEDPGQVGQSIEPAASDDESEPSSSAGLQLSFQPVETKQLLGEEPDPQLIKVRTYQYWGIQGQREVQLHLYTDPSVDQPFNQGEVHAYLQDQDAWYKIGVVGSYGIDDIEIALADRTEDQLRDLQITGTMGASYRELRVLSYNQTAQLWSSILTMGTPLIADLDSDGIVELAAVSAGSIPSYVLIYRWNQNRFEAADIAEQTKSQNVTISNQQLDGHYAWIIETDKGRYRYEAGKLVEV